MTYDEFANLVSDYMNRDKTLFDLTNSTVDKLLTAANNAKKAAQRRLIFELARTQVNITLDKTNGGDLTTATDRVSGAPVNVQTLEKAFLPTTDGLNIYPVDIVNRDANVRFVQRLTDDVFDPKRNNMPNQPSYSQIVRQATKLYLYPWDTRLYTGQSIVAAFDVIQWMPPYGKVVIGSATATSTNHLVNASATFITDGVVAGNVVFNTTDLTSAVVTAVNSETNLTLSADIFTSSEGYKVGTGVTTDFFLNDCTDWMLYRTIQELNLFLKEDQRVQVSAAFMKDAWDSVVTWNARLVGTNDELSLD